MASEASSLDSAVSSDGALHMERDNGGYSSVESAVGGPDCRNDYDGLQRDQTLHPMLIRHKHSDSMRRCDHTMKELDYYCGQHIVAMNQLEATSQESSALLGTYGDLVSDKQRLDREVQALQKEVSELRCQNQDVLVTNSGNSDTINQRYLSALRKYKAIEDEYDSLKKRYDDLLSSHSSAVNKLELAHEEAARFKKQYEEALQERNAAFREKNGLKQQCTSAIRQWDIAMRERNEYREALSKVQQQHEDAVKEINQAMMLRMKTSKDIKRLTEERNAALHEYTLIMGERDTVHKEMEKLGDDLAQAYAKITQLENQNKTLGDGKKTLSYQIETLRREISSALLDRDEAFKECNVLRQKFGDYSEVASRDYQNRLEIHSYNRERINSSKETECEVNTRDYSKREKETMDDLDQANLEIDRLRKQVEALQGELEEAIQEAEVSKRRRDWAFSERDKIVLEREALRSNCDRLRKERDRAVSEFASAIRDSDDIKRQRNEASKELKDLKEMIESDLLTRSSIYGHHEDNSNEWDVITIHLDLSRLCQDGDRDLGLILIGGRQDPYFPNDTGVYVAQINEGSIVSGKLRVNDCIIRVNNVDCTSVSTGMILETLRACTLGSATVTVRRKRSTRRYLRTTQLPIGDTIPHGIALELGIYISKISPGSSAAKDGNLSVGDRVLNINSKPMDSVTSGHEAMSLLNDSIADVLTITTLKGIPLSLASSSETMPDTGMIYGTDTKTQKMINNCSQTEQERLMLKATSDDYERRYMASNFNERSIYKVSKSVSGEKPSGISHAWDNIREKIDIVRGRRHSKDRDVDKKKRHRNSSPNTFEQEQDAIAELDSVIESYHQKKTTMITTATTSAAATMTMSAATATSAAALPASTNITTNSVLKRNKLRATEKMEKDGGTWPKVRGGPLIQNGTGTILHPRKTKERLPLSVLINHPPKYESYNYNRISNPIPLGNFSNVSNRHTVYKAMESPVSFSKSGQLFGQKSFTPVVIQFKDIATLEKKPASAEFEPVEPGRLSSSQAPSESSIDYSIKSANNDYNGHPQKRRLRQYGSNESQPDQSTLQHNRAHSQLYPLALSATLSNTSGSSSTAPRQQQLSEYNELQGTGSSSSPEPCVGAGGSHSGSPTPCNSPEVPRKSSLEHHEATEPERDGATATTTTTTTTTTSGKTTLTLPPAIREREVRASASMEVRDTQERAREIRNSASLDINIRKPELRNSATIDSIRGVSSLTRAQMNQAVTTLQRQNATVRSPTQEEQSRKSPPTIEPRYLFIETRKCSNLGISLVGGNGVGIFVHSVQPGCLAEDAGLRSGDRILEYNGVDLRQATAEQAALELARPADKVTLVAQYMPERYNEVKDKPGDSFYVKAMFDRVGEVGDSLQLRFNKDDVLYVDNTMFNGTPGHWRAWLVDQAGRRQQCGIIPSKFKIEEELLLRRSLGDLETDTGKRGTTSARRSFFRRKKHHRSSSRDSKELSTLTGVSLGWYSDSGTLNEENLPASYQRVERLDYPTLRPVLIIGPLSECVATKLLQDCPGDFTRCLPEAMHCSQATLEQGLRDSLYVDYRKKGSYFECTTVQAVKDVCAKNSHCILDVSIASIERLHRHQIYPIVLLIKFKSVKQIKEVKDSRYPSDKISAKAAKEMHEQSLKIEAEYKHHISDIIHAGVNVAYICTQVKAAVDCEQSKALWVPRGPP
ncbi:disks large homolog 5-like isoform X6 [Diachasmimorpha longicaudata]|uniref:disks large homolog 5-like isoform X6 n=1 Tax=Diachasmimorpha longicaudata TaxID=58733 RepID=UPI0030B8F6E4